MNVRDSKKTWLAWIEALEKEEVWELLSGSEMKFVNRIHAHLELVGKPTITPAEEEILERLYGRMIK